MLENLFNCGSHQINLHHIGNIGLRPNEADDSYQNSSNPPCIDFILTNYPKYFQNTTVIKTGWFDSHKIVVTIMKINFRKFEPKNLQYRNNKNVLMNLQRKSGKSAFSSWNQYKW